MSNVVDINAKDFNSVIAEPKKPVVVEFWIKSCGNCKKFKPVYKKSGGYARIATIFKQIKNEKNGKVIILDNGDTLHGTFPAVESKGKATLRLMKLTELIDLYAEYLEMDPDLFYFTSTA